MNAPQIQYSKALFVLTLGFMIASIAFVSSFETATAEPSQYSTDGSSGDKEGHEGKECPTKNKSGEKSSSTEGA